MNQEGNKFSNINLRVSTLKDFWGNEYSNYLYLFLASKRYIKFDKILYPKICNNPFVTKVEFKN